LILAALFQVIRVVMAGLVPAIHALLPASLQDVDAGTRPGMTTQCLWPLVEPIARHDRCSFARDKQPLRQIPMMPEMKKATR
jgi:hypothetical protein